MKKNLIIGITTAAILAASAGSALAAPAVSVNGQTLQLEQPPVIVESRTLVPMRAIFEALGCDVTWNADDQSVLARKKLDYVSLAIGDNTLYSNDKTIQLDVPAQIVNGHVMVPLRSVSEALDAQAVWNADTQLISITAPTQGDYKYTTKHFTESKDRISVDMAYPQLIYRVDADNTIFSSLNKQWEAAAHARAVAFQTEAKGLLADVTEENNRFWTTEERFAVTYNRDKHFSVLFENMINTGGAHPNTLRNSAIYDMTTGKSLTLSDILNGDQKQIEQIILDGFSARIKAEPDTFYPEAETYLQEAIANKTYGYYLSEEGLTFYFQKYEIAPYAAGFQEYTLPFNQTDAFKLAF